MAAGQSDTERTLPDLENSALRYGELSFSWGGITAQPGKAGQVTLHRPELPQGTAGSGTQRGVGPGWT